jgi:outer membrane biosynthesis protein TonB
VQRADATGLGVAAAGHILLFGVLSLGLITAPKPVPPLTQPVDIQIVDEVGLKDTVPNPSPVEPAPSVAPDVGPPVEAPVTDPAPTPLPKVAPAPAPPKPVPPKPTPKVATPAPAPKSQPKPAPAPASKPAAAPLRPKLALDLPRPGGAAPRGSRLGADFLKGVSDRPNASTAQTPRAAAGPAVEASLAREVLRQLKPHWKAPTGADAEQLRTTLSISLTRDGQVASVRVIETTGITDSNRGQVRLHQEAAVKAVRLAAPFVLPAELYDAWKVLEPVGFDKRLG